jgi:hypothetical protein
MSRTLSSHGRRRLFPARIAASEASDFNKANAPFSDKQNTLSDKVAQKIGLHKIYANI